MRFEFFSRNYKKHSSAVLRHINLLPKNRRFDTLKLIYRTADSNVNLIDHIMKSLSRLQNDDERLYFFHEALDKKSSGHRNIVFKEEHIKCLEKEENRFKIFQKIMSTFDYPLRIYAIKIAKRVLSSNLALIGLYSLGITDRHELVRFETIQEAANSPLSMDIKKIFLKIATRDSFKKNADTAQNHIDFFAKRGL